MEIDLETLIQKITRQVISELENRGVHITASPIQNESGCDRRDSEARAEKPDLSAYRTPVLTERHILRLQPETCRIIVPAGTVISPRAREMLKEKNIRLQTE